VHDDLKNVYIKCLEFLNNPLCFRSFQTKISALHRALREWGISGSFYSPAMALVMVFKPWGLGLKMFNKHNITDINCTF
jgi:hypothetical protein